MPWHKKTVANTCIEKVIMMIKQAAIDLIVALKGYTLPKQAEYAYNQLCKAISEQEEHCSWTNQPWKDLTEKESVDIAVACGCMSVDWLDLVKAVQQALKAKNT